MLELGEDKKVSENVTHNLGRKIIPSVIRKYQEWFCNPARQRS